MIRTPFYMGSTKRCRQVTPVLHNAAPQATTFQNSPEKHERRGATIQQASPRRLLELTTSLGWSDDQIRARPRFDCI